MKGIVFTELLEFAEESFGFDLVDQAVEQAQLPSGGSYTAVGTYDHAELVSLVVQMSGLTGVPVSELCRLYGFHLLGRFYTLYPGFFDSIPNSFSFLERIENHIHVEVKKLYPEAELPSFSNDLSVDGEMRLLYRSERGFGHLALGLIQGTVAHFGEQIEITMTDKSDGLAKEVEFYLKRFRGESCAQEQTSTPEAHSGVSV